jgi:hypothetical protein
MFSRSARRPTSDLTAYDLYLRAYAVVRSSGRILDALRLVEQAIERDPNYAPALAYAAVCHRRLVIDGQSEDPDTTIRQGATWDNGMSLQKILLASIRTWAISNSTCYYSCRSTFSPVNFS